MKIKIDFLQGQAYDSDKWTKYQLFYGFSGCAVADADFLGHQESAGQNDARNAELTDGMQSDRIRKERLMPTRHFTWRDAQRLDAEREHKHAEKVKGHIQFTVMSGWRRLAELSIEKPEGIFYKARTKIKLPKENR